MLTNFVTFGILDGGGGLLELAPADPRLYFPHHDRDPDPLRWP